MNRTESRTKRQASARRVFAQIADTAAPPAKTAPPLLTVLPDPRWIIAWRKSALRFLADGRGYEMVTPAKATTFASEHAAIDLLRARGIRMADLAVIEKGPQ